MPSTEIQDYWRRAWGIGDRERVGFFEAGFVGQGEHKNKWSVEGFYSKTQDGKFPNPDGTTQRHAYFDSKAEALEAIKNRKLKSSRGLTLKEMDKKYKKLLKNYGLKSWADATRRQKMEMKSKMAYKYVPEKSWITEGLASKVNKETKRLLNLKKPINQATGLPYTLKEFSEIRSNQMKSKIIKEMKGKPKRTSAWPIREGWYPEKNANRLLTYMEKAAKQQAALKTPLKNRTFINVYEMVGDKRKFVGVRDVKTNTLYTHVDYDLSKPGAKKGKIITNHPDMERFLTYFDEAQKFKYDRPTKLLGNYFSQYSKVPTYNQIYNFFTMHAGTQPHIYKEWNALTVHHQNLVKNKPTKNFQLLINKANTEANTILTKLQNKKISKAEAIRQLEAISARVEGMGIKASDIAPKKGLAIAKKEAVKKFTEAIKKNPAIVDEMAKALNLDKKQKIKLNTRLNSAIPIDDMVKMIASDFKIPAKAVGNVLGKVLKVLGPASFALDVIPFVQARDLGIENWGAVGGKNLAEIYLNLPRIIEDLAHVATEEGTWKTFGSKKEEDRVWKGKAEFGQRATVKALREISTEDLIKNIKAQEKSASETFAGQLVLDPFVDEGEINKRIEKALKLKEYYDSLPEDHPLVKKEKEKVDIKETENVFGTQIPMKNITEPTPLKNQWLNKGGLSGVDQYILNRYK